MNMYSIRKLCFQAFRYGSLLIFVCVLLLPLPSFGGNDPIVTVGFNGKTNIKPAEPISIGITVKSKIPLTAPKLSLMVPPIASALEKKVVLWKGDREITFPHESKYRIPVLVPGRYKFETILEFVAPRETEIPLLEGKRNIVAVNKNTGEKTYQLRSSLCFDVRPDRIYVGPSFELIEKKELIREISLKSGKNNGLKFKNLWRLPIASLETMNGGPWKDKIK